jgi:hypothetical protein
VTQQSHFDLPADPPGYGIRYTDDGDKFEVTRLADQEVLGQYATREEAVEAALTDAGGPDPTGL